MTENQTIAKEQCVEGCLRAMLYDEGYIEISWDASVEVIEVEHLVQMRETVYQLGGGKKMPLFFSPDGFANISEEGKYFATSDEGVEYTLAVAVLLDNLAKRLLMNFFLRTSRPKVPTKGFTSRSEAISWLLAIRQEKERN